jgi:hypothetical protein
MYEARLRQNPLKIGRIKNGDIKRGLTTHSTGAEIARMLSTAWMLIGDTCRPVNSGVRHASHKKGAEN